MAAGSVAVADTGEISCARRKGRLSLVLWYDDRVGFPAACGRM